MAQHKEADAEANEAMARQFRPIAPRPLPPSSPPLPNGAMVSSFLLQSRERGWQDHHLMPSPVLKRERDAIYYLAAPTLWAANDAEPPAVTRGWCIPENILPSCEERFWSLSIEGSSALPWAPSPDVGRWFLVEHDLISKLHVPKVIRPRPARPRRTTINIDCSNIFKATNFAVPLITSKKTAREVEVEMERLDALPTIVSGCNNIRVHLTNDAYKAMVGQTVCPWLDTLPGTGASRRINGEVVLEVHRFNTTSRLPSTGDAFPCTARISWECEDAIASLTVPCAVEGLTGNSVDYCFIWRFDSRRASILYCIA
ncbi:hypothetical protein BAE44_0022228 [Dichanthelium oligosanthes]|uniref:Uncharacterized protein n=1 Tax=Dichanthelium oligosanthes TaxID=888268 RepID=A0A1E5UV62_9POAL|nr:hypothetical protein BAE44_0022228 [Dichanthelium oligosanthes]